MAFFQDAPRLGNQYDDDALFKEYLLRVLPPDLLRAIEPELRHLGDLAGGELYRQQQEDRLNEPKLTQWDPWGRRVDQIELSPLWKRAQVLAAQHGLVAIAYERRNAELSRVHQFAVNYLLDASLDVYSCPLAMTDGAARTLLDSGNAALIERALPHLTSRDPARMWTSGQWMTERTGGSDVGLSEAIARKDGEQYRLYGTKYFTSATTSPMALTLARPEGNGPGGRGLALFYLELHDDLGRSNGIKINRLKEKLGTRKVPTAELELEGTLATAVMGTQDGVRNITPMLNITRTWNAVGAATGMRRGLALAQDYAARRAQFGHSLDQQPLHVDTLAAQQAEFNAAFLLTFRTVEMLGRREAGVASDAEKRLMRALTPITKLTTGKQAVACTSEAIEAFGGAGYMEDTGLPRIVRDAQVLPIWEGTTNVLSLETMKALARDGGFDAVTAEIERALAAAGDASLAEPVRTARSALGHVRATVAKGVANPGALEASARRISLTLGRTLALALACEHATWAGAHAQGPRAAAAARRFARQGIDQLVDVDDADSQVLAGRRS